MAKLTLNDITAGYASNTALNTAFTAIETALENTVSRDGTSPNQMGANLDMNGYAILNQRATSGTENFIWSGTWTTGTSYTVNNLVYAPEGSNLGNTLICVTAHTAGATLDGDAAKWAVFAQRGAPGASGGNIVGPASSTADSLARWNGTTGLLLKDGAVIGTHVQAYNAQLATLSAITATQATDLAALSTFMGTVLNDTTATAARTTLGTNNLLAEYTVSGSAVSNIQFTGLDINTHKSYRVEVELINASASAIALYAFVNGDTTTANYYSQEGYFGGVAYSALRSNQPQVAGVAGSMSFSATINLNLISGIPALTAIIARNLGASASSIEVEFTAVSKTASVANITQLDFTSSVASAIGVGSKIRIYRGDN